MTTSQTNDLLAWRGHTVVDRDGDKVGKLDEIYLDQETGRPEWGLVNTGLFGGKSSFVPLSGAQPDGDDLRVAYEGGQVKDAPKIEPERELSTDEEQALYEHYGLGYSAAQSTDDRPPVGEDVSGPTTDDAMTRSEEELRVGKTQTERGRVRLKKYVVTEEVTQTVPVQ